MKKNMSQSPSFETILDPNVIDGDASVNLSDLRRLAAKGIPDHPPQVRPLVYSLLLGTIPLDKGQWEHAQRNQRRHYRRLARNQFEALGALPPPKGLDMPADKLLSRIARDVVALQKRYPILAQPLPMQQSPSSLSESTIPPLESLEDVESVQFSSDGESCDSGSEYGLLGQLPPQDTRQAGRGSKPHLEDIIFRRLTIIARLDDTSSNEVSSTPNPHETTSQSPTSSPTSGERLGEPSSAPSLRTPLLSLSVPDDASDQAVSGSPITLLMPKAIPKSTSSHWKRNIPEPNTHARLLCCLVHVLASSNPQWTYQQNITLIAAHLYSTFSEVSWKSSQRRGKPYRSLTVGNESAEVPTFWALCALLREFEPVITGPSPNVPPEMELETMLSCLSRRARWADEPLWSFLDEHHLAPGSPTYCIEWLNNLMLGAVPPSTANSIWDYLLASRSTPAAMTDAIDAIIDIAVATLLVSRSSLLGTYGQRPDMPAILPRGGLWGESEPSRDSQLLDAQDLLGLLRSPPLRPAASATILQIAQRLRDSRLVEGVSELNLSVAERKPEESGWTAWRPGAWYQSAPSVSRLSSLTETGARLTTSAYEKLSEKVSQIPTRLPTHRNDGTGNENTWSQITARKLSGLWKTPQAMQDDGNQIYPDQRSSSVDSESESYVPYGADTEVAAKPNGTRASPRSSSGSTRPNLQGPRPLLLNASPRRVSQRADASSFVEHPGENAVAV